jgi:hypothetical protein
MLKKNFIVKQKKILTTMSKEKQEKYFTNILLNFL